MATIPAILQRLCTATVDRDKGRFGAIGRCLGSETRLLPNAPDRSTGMRRRRRRPEDQLAEGLATHAVHAAAGAAAMLAPASHSVLTEVFSAKA
jgi:hypothetical protein